MTQTAMQHTFIRSGLVVAAFICTNLSEVWREYLIKKFIEDILIFFSVRSNFISPNVHQKQYFHEWRRNRRRKNVAVSDSAPDVA